MRVATRAYGLIRLNLTNCRTCMFRPDQLRRGRHLQRSDQRGLRLGSTVGAGHAPACHRGWLARPWRCCTTPRIPRSCWRAPPSLIEFDTGHARSAVVLTFGPGAQGRRFPHLHPGRHAERIRSFATGRACWPVTASDSRCSSAVPLDETFVAAVAEMSRELGGFEWYSEPSQRLHRAEGQRPPTPRPVSGCCSLYDDESYAIVSGKLKRLREVLGCCCCSRRAPSSCPCAPDSDMSEPQFLEPLLPA